ncbi:MAG: calcium/sodium antiporter [Bacteroidales bacterium]|nr:calcium/sodium antiporter [Bacteroidales bacterium]
MLVQIILLLVGLLLLVGGANYLVDGASDIARKSGTSEFVIGLTIVAIGTSMPEMAVSFYSSIFGNSEIAIGNIVGSNVFNTALILGVTCLIAPTAITKGNLRRDLPINIFATLLLIFMALNHTVLGLGKNMISRVDGAILLALFVLYLYVSLKYDEEIQAGDEDGSKPHRTWVAIVMLAGGIAALIIGAHLFVDAAVYFARRLNVSDTFIAITLVAGGTSLPELATCIVAAAKKKSRLALGNIIGSNVSNIFLIIGGSALIRPIESGNITYVDYGVLLFLALFLLIVPLIFRRRKIGRAEGAVLVLVFAAYFAWLVYSL